MSRAPLSTIASALALWQHDAMAEPTTAPSSAARTARERARVEITREILDAGRRHLAIDGAPALSLRAIARDLGMASSAVYRYVASRDELLTLLIIDAYNALGAAAEAAEAAVERGDLAGRWRAICFSVRTWALANPNEYALIYGSPVPGYEAPPDTVAPATRVSNLLVGILMEAVALRRLEPEIREERLSAEAHAALEPLRSFVGGQAPDALLQRGLMVWTALYGTVSFELFGQLHNVIREETGDREAFFAECVRRWADQVGIA